MKKKKLVGIVLGIATAGVLCFLPILNTEAANEPFKDIDTSIRIFDVGIYEEKNIEDAGGPNVKTTIKKLYYKENDERYERELFDAIQWLNSKGFFQDIPTRDLKDPFMRADFMVTFWNCAGRKYEGTNYFFETYPDIKYDLIYENGVFKGHKNYYTIAALWGLKNGIMSGFPTAGVFNAFDGIKRQDAITAITNYYLAIGNSLDVTSADIEKVLCYNNLYYASQYWWAERMAWVVKNNIVVAEEKFEENDIIDESDIIVRGAEPIRMDEGVIMLYRFFKVLETEGSLNWDINKQK